MPLELSFLPKNTKPAAHSCDVSGQTARAVAAPGGAAMLRCALIPAVPLERWSVYVSCKARKATLKREVIMPWEQLSVIELYF